MAASRDSAKPNAFNPDTVPLPPSTFKQVTVTPLLPISKLITVAGQIGSDFDTSAVPETFDEQVKLAYKNLLNCLKAADATPRDIIYVRHYVVDKSEERHLGVRKAVFDRGWSSLWTEFMDQEGLGHRPSDAVLGVVSLARPNLLYEVEAWAIVNH